MSVVFDIETEPLPDDDLMRVCEPFNPNSVPHPGLFDPDSVKLGNVKDSIKRAEKIHAAQKAHAELVANYDSNLAAAEQAHWREIRDKAALDATTGRVCAIGYKSREDSEKIQTALETSEADLVRGFWEAAAKMRSQQRKMIGHYSNSFDVPFLVRRSWILGIPVPDWITTPTGYLNPMFIDTMAVWQVGNRRDSIKLDRLATALDCGSKPDDCTGAHFYMMLRGEGAEREAAIEYLRNDLQMPFLIARKLGLI